MLTQIMSDEREERLKKLDVLRGLGVDPYGARFDGRQEIGSVVAAYPQNEGKDLTVAGRVMAYRKMGKAVVFLDLRDWTGKVQCYIKKNEIGEESFEIFGNVGIGDIIGVTGRLGKSKTGEITIFSKKFSMLTKSLRPLPEKWHGLKDPDTRYRHRYLDMIANPEVRETMQKRSRIVNALREFLNGRGYVEVETPVLTSLAGGAAARPFETHHNALGMDLFLRIATEIPLKKLLVGGMEKVYEIGRVFRNEGIDANHNPEFTLLELYHAYGDLESMMELVETTVAHLAQECCGTTELPWGDGTIRVTPPWPRKDFYELFSEQGVDPKDENELKSRLQKHGKDSEGLSGAELLDAFLGEFVEPNLQDAVFVTGQPIELSPLCREDPGNPGRALRFESYLAGAELSNAYTELNDPQEQRRRLIAQAEGDASKIDEDFLLALEYGMPPAGGMGMGIDRLVKVLTNRRTIREIIPFPLLRESNPAGPSSAK